MKFFNNFFRNEPCVNCGNITPVTRSRLVPKRKYYVEGAGQLCEKCYNLIYKK